MVAETQGRIETCGFVQLVREPTRFWPQTEDSLIDQIWTNAPNKIVQCSNIVRSVGDHNIVGATMRLKGTQSYPQEVLKRHRKNFSAAQYNTEIENIDWSDLYSEEDPNLAYNIFEETIGKILDNMAPFKVYQVRNHYNSWLTDETKTLMRDRDIAREKARLTKNNQDWTDYKKFKKQMQQTTNKG